VVYILQRYNEAFKSIVIYDKYDRYRHAVYKLQYHLVVATKYRHPVITGELKPYYWEPYFWSDAYFISSVVSDVSEDVIREYIQEQKSAANPA